MFPETPAELQVSLGEQSLRLVEETVINVFWDRLLWCWNALPTTELTPNLRRLRANVYQSLHRFDEAVSDLKAVLVQQGDDAQAVFLLATVQLAQGHYASGRSLQSIIAVNADIDQCQLRRYRFGAHWRAQNAYEKLTQLYAWAAPQNVDANPPEINTAVLHFAQVSLAEIAEQIGLPDAKTGGSSLCRVAPKSLCAVSAQPIMPGNQVISRLCCV